MNFYRLSALLSSFILSVTLSFAQHLDNPVIPGLCDCGVLRYNGQYYIGGVCTSGGFYTSDDLVHWNGPKHVFTMDNDWAGPASSDDNIHADDIRYINGKFEFYWSVNHWGDDKTVVHIAHASSDNVLGPYKEPDRSTWFDSRIDPMVFEDIDGSLYLYSVKFTEGNTIWVQKMADPCTFSGEPVYQFASMPGTWETLDNRVLEGPWVILYRGKYYMIYNANHTDTLWGNYQFGAAVADSPVGFQNGGKYPYPVLTSNQLDLEDNHTNILIYADKYEPLFRYCFDKEPKGWQEPEFDDSKWKEGPGGFGTERIPGSMTHTAGSKWEGRQLLARKHFTVSNPSRLDNLALRLFSWNPIKVWLNGKLILEASGGDSITNLPKKASEYLRKGDNVLAFETTRSGAEAWLEIALFDMGDEIADDILYTPGQPNLVKGPNGLEWWMVFMANKNSDSRGQYVSRVHFSGERLYIEPISSSNTRRYVSTPSKPQVFEKFEGGSTELKSGKFVDSQYASSTFYYETMLKTDGAVDFVLGKNFKVRIDSRNGSVLVGEKSHKLPSGIDWSCLHQIIVRRNSTRATLTIDGKPVNGCTEIFLPSDRPVSPGLIPVNGQSEIGNIIYTVGWDEYGPEINGWEVTDGCFGSGPMTAFKAEPASAYDFSLKVTSKNKAGAYPVWQDENNFVQMALDQNASRMDITVCRNGISEVSPFSLDHIEALYQDIKYSDFMMHTYTFKDPVTIDRLFLPKKTPGPRIEDLYSLMDVEYRFNGKWIPLEFNYVDSSKYCIAEMAPTKMDALRLTNRIGNDSSNYIYRITAHETFRDSYHLHFIREGESLVIKADGRDIATIGLEGFGDSRVGLFSEGDGNGFEGIVYFRK